MNFIHIDSPADPRVAPYAALKERELSKKGNRFIAESELVVRRLLNSPFPTESVFVVDRKAEEIAEMVPAGIPIYVASSALMREIIGYKFHSGVLACGIRIASPTLDSVIEGAGKQFMLVVCTEPCSTENLGAIIRIAAAFGAAGIVLGERACDPFFRQSVRISMGAVFHLPIVRSIDIFADLKRMQNQWGIELAAAVAEGVGEPIATAKRRPKFAMLFGNEAQGLRPEEIEACDRRVTIPMNLGIDSLNVAVAVGIFIYHFANEAMVITDPKSELENRELD